MFEKKKTIKLYQAANKIIWTWQIFTLFKKWVALEVDSIIKTSTELQSYKYIPNFLSENNAIHLTDGKMWSRQFLQVLNQSPTCHDVDDVYFGRKKQTFICFHKISKKLKKTSNRFLYENYINNLKPPHSDSYLLIEQKSKLFPWAFNIIKWMEEKSHNETSTNQHE